MHTSELDLHVECGWACDPLELLFHGQILFVRVRMCTHTHTHTCTHAHMHKHARTHMHTHGHRGDEGGKKGKEEGKRELDNQGRAVAVTDKLTTNNVFNVSC